MQLTLMKPHIYDLDRGEWFSQIPEETTQCSTKLMQLNYSYLKIFKFTLFSHPFVSMLLDDKILLP